MIDETEVRRSLHLLIDPGQTFEIRGLPSGRSRICRGDELEEAVRAASEFGDGWGVYYTLNPLRPNIEGAAKDGDVIGRRWLLVDCDPVRHAADSNTASTEAEKAKAYELANQIIHHLTGEGWPSPVVVDSGNGYHLLYRIDMPATPESRDTIKRALAALADKFDTDSAGVDRVVHNASRIAKLPGTYSRKGGRSTPDRPFRLSKIIFDPGEVETVPTERLERLAAPPKAEPTNGTAHEDKEGPWKTRATNGDDNSAYIEKTISENCYKVATAIAGPAQGRNNVLNTAAFNCGQLAAWAGMNAPDAKRRLLAAGLQSGLGEHESRKAIESGWRGGEAKPKFPRDFNQGENRRSAGSAGSAEGYGNSKSDPRTWNEEDWEDPDLGSLPDIEPFPLDVLPFSLAELCRRAAESMHCPVDYFASCALAMSGAVIGQTVNLKVKSGWYVSPHLYLAIVAPPGAKKSPAISMMARPLFEIDRGLRDSYQAELQLYREHCHALGKGALKPDEPIPRHLTLDDVTREAVGQVHSENLRGLAVIKDELASWMTSLDAYRAGKGGDAQFWLSVNSGSMVKVTRKGTRVSIVIQNPCISIVGGLTPSSIPMMAGSGRDDGWLDRIVFSYPDQLSTPQSWDETEIPADLVEDWSKAIRNLWSRSLYLDEKTGRERPYNVDFDVNAKTLWAQFYNAHCREKEASDFPPYLKGPWSKLELFTARLCLILSQLHHAYSPDYSGRHPAQVDGLAVYGATQLCAYFKSHFKRARFSLRGGDRPDAVTMILKWIETHDIKEFTKRDLTRWRSYKFDPSSVSDALAWLQRRKCIQNLPQEKLPTGQPKSPLYAVNPKLLPISRTCRTCRTPEGESNGS